MKPKHRTPDTHTHTVTNTKFSAMKCCSWHTKKSNCKYLRAKDKKKKIFFQKKKKKNSLWNQEQQYTSHHCVVCCCKILENLKQQEQQQLKCNLNKKRFK